MYFCVDVKDMKIRDYGQSYDIILAFLRCADTGEPRESIQPEEIKACIWVCTEEVSVSAEFQRLIFIYIYIFFFFFFPELFGVPVCKKRTSRIVGNPYNLPEVI